MTVPTVIIEEATGAVAAVDPGIDKTIAVIGCTATGTNGSTALYGTARGVYTNRGIGPAQRLAGAVLAKNAGKALVVLQKTPTVTAGSFGTIDDSGITGSAEAAFTGVPLDRFHLYMIVTDDGNDGDGTTIGTDGIRYKIARDRGTMQGPYSLGTSSTISFDGTGATLAFNPVAATLVAPTNALRTAVLAHFPKTSSSIHGAADSTSDDGVGAVCTTNANAIPLINTLRVAILLHFARGSTVHTVADTTSGGASNANIPAAAVTQQEALVLLNALIVAWNLHVVNLSYHGGSDAANAVASTTPDQGTLKTGDVVFVDTFGPKWDSDGITAAFQTLGASDQNFGIVAIAGPVSAAEAAVVSAGMDYLATRGKRPLCIFATRDIDTETDETEQEWLDDVKADYSAYTDSRVTRCATPSRATIDDGISVRVYDTNALHAVCARLVSFDLVSQSPGEVALGALEGIAITDSSGTLLPSSHDEGGDIQGLDGEHFLTLMRLPDPTRARGVYITWPWVAYKEGVDRVQTLMTRRVVNKGERIMAATSFGMLGSAKTFIPGTLPGTGALSVPAANIIKAQQLGPLRSEGGLKREISNPDDPDLVTVDRNVTVNGEKVSVVCHLNITAFKYVGNVTIILNVKEL